MHTYKNKRAFCFRRATAEKHVDFADAYRHSGFRRFARAVPNPDGVSPRFESGCGTMYNLDLSSGHCDFRFGSSTDAATRVNGSLEQVDYLSDFEEPPPFALTDYPASANFTGGGGDSTQAWDRFHAGNSGLKKHQLPQSAWAYHKSSKAPTKSSRCRYRIMFIPAVRHSM